MRTCWIVLLIITSIIELSFDENNLYITPPSFCHGRSVLGIMNAYFVKLENEACYGIFGSKAFSRSTVLQIENKELFEN